MDDHLCHILLRVAFCDSKQILIAFLLSVRTSQEAIRLCMRIPDITGMTAIATSELLWR